MEHADGGRMGRDELDRSDEVTTDFAEFRHHGFVRAECSCNARAVYTRGKGHV
jgi:hypothetical protein